MPFARAVVDLIEEMKASSRGQPELGDAVPPAMTTLAMEWTSDHELWEFVEFDQVFTYLRGSKRLNIPRVSTIDSQKDLIGN